MTATRVHTLYYAADAYAMIDAASLTPMLYFAEMPPLRARALMLPALRRFVTTLSYAFDAPCR